MEYLELGEIFKVNVDNKIVYLKVEPDGSQDGCDNCYFYNSAAICGSRGWAWEEGEAHDEKIWNRELLRLEASLKEAAKKNPEEIYCFLHYPPVVDRNEVSDFEQLMIKYGVKRCYYGHLHSLGLKNAYNGNKEGVEYQVVSADYLNFRPIMVIK